MDYVLWRSYFIFWLWAWLNKCATLALSALTNGSVLYLSHPLQTKTHLNKQKSPRFPFSQVLILCPLSDYSTVGWDHSLQYLYSCHLFQIHAWASVRIQLQSVYGLQKSGWGGLRRTADLSSILFISLSPAPPIFFPLCLSVCSHSISTNHGLFSSRGLV